jgi:hypothetical protein
MSDIKASDASSGRVRVVVVTLLVGAGIGYLLGYWRGSAGTEASAKRAAEARREALLESNTEWGRALTACRQVIRGATRTIEARSAEIENLYEDMADHVRTAYELGVEGDQEELQFGLGRFIYDKSELERVFANELALNGWTGWADDEQLDACYDEDHLGLP